jgi:hypothetical protein
MVTVTAFDTALWYYREPEGVDRNTWCCGLNTVRLGLW